MTDNNFSELIIHTLKQIHIRLDPLEAKVDEKADKADVKNLEQHLDGVESRLDWIERWNTIHENDTMFYIHTIHSRNARFHI